MSQATISGFRNKFLSIFPFPVEAGRGFFIKPMAGFLSPLAAALLLLATCGRSDDIDIETITAGNPSEVYGAGKIEARGSLSSSQNPDAINFGITPWEKPAKLRKMFAPLIQYLSEQLGSRVRFIVSQDYTTLVNDLAGGIAQIAAFSPGAYAVAREKNPDDLIYVATASKAGKDHYRGMIFTREDSAVNSIADLKGKTFGFVEKGSSSGYKFPLLMFLRKNINPYKFFSKVFFLGSHPNVAEAVHLGKVDAGATWDAAFEVAQEKYNQQLKIIVKTPPIPFDAIVVAKKQGKKFALKLRSILTKIGPETKTGDGRQVISSRFDFPYTGWTTRGPAFYNIVTQTNNAIQDFEKN